MGGVCGLWVVTSGKSVYLWELRCLEFYRVRTSYSLLVRTYLEVFDFSLLVLFAPEFAQTKKATNGYHEQSDRKYGADKKPSDGDRQQC